MSRLARLLVVIVALVSATTVSARVVVAADSGTTTAVVVIDTGSSVRAVTVDVGSGMSGLAVLQRVANVTTLVFSGNGGAVCSIDGVGNDASPSSCLVGPHSEYWAFFYSAGGSTSWTYSPVGAGSFTVHGGDVEGWRYGTGAKPRASAVFCDYVSCPVPPTTSAGGASGSTGSPSTEGSAGTATPGSGGSGSATTGAAGESTTPTDPEPATSTTVAPATDKAGTASTGRRGTGVRVEAAASRGGGTDSGSPVGVAVAAGLLAIAAGSAVLLRRRSHVPG